MVPSQAYQDFYPRIREAFAALESRHQSALNQGEADDPIVAKNGEVIENTLQVTPFACMVELA